MFLDYAPSVMTVVFWVLVILALNVVAAFFLRTVVPTNAVDIVQSATRTVSYGKGEAAGNVYYRWPSWLPRIGLRVIRLPVSVFSEKLEDYAAYDKGRVPFVIDIIAFFRINDSSVAAQRVTTMPELASQLEFILKGAIRTILASSEIEEILEGRSRFGEMFTHEVDEQLRQWGVGTVKNIELMDIRDATGSQVIANIMAKKKSLIEKESRVAVAGNIQIAQVAEVEAQQAVELRKREAEQLIGQRAAQRDQEIGIAQQRAQQAVKEEEKNTATKAMAVNEVNTVRAAEIARSAQVVAADQGKQVAIIEAEAEKQKTILVADGSLEAARRHATGVEVNGEAEGKAQTAVLMAPVTTQITLAKEIGQNPAYQAYLVSIRQIDANQVVGIEQAHALQAAEIKVIANAGNVVDGVKSAMELLTPKGGTQIGAALEAFKQTDVGKAVVAAVTTGTSAEARE
jgi:flotillin